jgi:hypothetical protein
MQTFLKVTAVQTTENGKPFADKNGRKFQKVTFAEVQYLLNGQEILTSKFRTRNLFDSTPDQKGDALYGQLQVGNMVAGSIQSFNTTTFTVNDRQVNKTTVVVFDGESPVSYANSQLKRNGACVVNEHGEPTATFNVAPAVAKETNSIFNGFDGFDPADPIEVEEEEEIEARN